MKAFFKHFKRWLDEDEFDFAKLVFKNFESDLSYLPEDKFLECKNGIYNSLLYPSVDGSKEKVLKKGIGIGSPISQIVGVLYPCPIDNLCKNKLGIKEYGRYMDDFYIICKSKSELDEYTYHIKNACESIKLKLNEKKIRTYRLNEEYTFLKIVYHVCENGHIIKRPCSETMRRERRRIRKMKNKIDSGEIPQIEVKRNYGAWKGGYAKFDAGNALRKMDRYAYERGILR